LPSAPAGKEAGAGRVLRDREVEEDMPGCVVIGIGNLLHGDDGFGIHAVRLLRGKLPEEVELVEGGVLGLDLLPYLEGKKKAIFIDALDIGEDAGAVYRFSPDQVKQRPAGPPLSVHDLGLYELVNAAQLLGQCPRSIIFIAVQVKGVELGGELSEEVRAALPTVCRMVREEVQTGR